MSQLTTRDYKGSGRRSGALSASRDFLFGLLAGTLLAGGGAAFLIARADHRPAPVAGACATAAAAGTRGQSSSASGGADVTASASSTSAPASAPQQYDFYRMLPRFTVSVPHPAAVSQPAVATRAPSQPDAAGASATGYILQVGSYTSGSEAQHVTQRLARMGVTARIERVADGARTLNRVRIGPIAGGPALEHLRAELAGAGMHALVIPTGQ